MSKKNDNSKNRKQNDNKDKNKKILLYILISILSVVLIASIIYGIIKDNKDKDVVKENEITYTDLIKQIDEGNVEKVRMTVGSTTVKVNIKGEEKPKTSIIPSTQAFVELVQNKKLEGNNIELVQVKPNFLLALGDKIFTILPTVLMAILFVILIKMQGLDGKGKFYDATEEDVKTTFDDVAGLDEEKQEMIEIVSFLKNPDEFYKMGAKIPKGVLLCGKPGTGKTLIAKAIAGEANVPFITMNGSEFTEMFAGLGASRVRKLFEKAKKVSPAIIFIDEIDAVGSKRSEGGSAADLDNNQTLNQLLVEMDGFDSDHTVIVLAATNRPEMLDQALLRPGRFDRQITIALPDMNGREAILKIHAKDKKLAPDVDLRAIAGDTAGFTGAELANILNEAAIIATINKQEAITNKDIDDALKKVTVGVEKHSRIMSDRDKKITAYHESGHAIVSRFLETQKDIKEVSIIPRGVAGGYTMYKTNEDKYYISKTEMLEKMIALLGGRAAEKIIFDDISTGASNDLEVATNVAKDMIIVYGMSEKLGPISINIERDPYQMQLYGNNMENEIGQEVRTMVDTAYVKAQTILLEHMDKLHELANLLIQKEVISSEEFNKLFE
ncbi:MAG: ATP-dependent zinc metalloprotease FtsH [Clostridium sp.]|nr:ATP-dependent zinc metalloprotease FtsH [Clostridium sp.]